MCIRVNPFPIVIPMKADMNSPFDPNIDSGLLIRFLSGEANLQEQQQVQAWVDVDRQHKKYLEEITLLWQQSSQVKALAAIDTQADWQKVRARITWQAGPQKVKPVWARQGWQYTLAKLAAILVILVGIVIWGNPAIRQRLFSNPITYTATSPTSLTLADGSRVHLNTNARLTYPQAFSGNTREVSLSGEAFFEVAKNKDKPFLIHSGSVVTQVVGTSFNINAPVPDSVLVTVLTGKVALFNPDAEQGGVILTPGELGAYNQGGFKKSINLNLNFLAWKTGVLIFKNTPLPQVIRDLNHYYHQPIQLNSTLNHCELTTTFDQQTLEEVLSELQVVLPIRISRQGKTIVISGDGC
jgi:ferric-dicitrate binding protein FerR (iron transport regulator)